MGEYSRHGKLVKGDAPKVVRSSFEEDQYINNHTSVWGSWWSNGQWGYKCCHQLVKNSYCTGEAGKQVVFSSLTIPSTSTNVECIQLDKMKKNITEKQKKDNKKKAHHHRPKMRMRRPSKKQSLPRH